MEPVVIKVAQTMTDLEGNNVKKALVPETKDTTKEEQCEPECEEDRIQRQTISLPHLGNITPTLVTKLQTATGRDKGPATAADVALCLFSMLRDWMVERGLDQSKVRIGWIKETQKYGNTSVSNGEALWHDLLPGESILCVNCGTSSTKLQLYKNKDGVLVPVRESKGELPVMSNIPCGSYKVKANPMTPEAAAPLIQEAIQQWQKEHSPVFTSAFVTGKIREEFYANSNDYDNIREMFGAMHIVFGNTCNPYFMSQEDEGERELMAINALYKNISPLFPNPLNVIASCGIGGGSTQWQFSSTTEKGAKGPLMAAKVGMTHEPDVMKTTLVNAWREFLATNEPYLLEALKKPCVIALKSGFAIGFEWVISKVMALLNKEQDKEKKNQVEENVEKKIVNVVNEYANVPNEAEQTSSVPILPTLPSGLTSLDCGRSTIENGPLPTSGLPSLDCGNKNQSNEGGTVEMPNQSVNTIYLAQPRTQDPSACAGEDGKKEENTEQNTEQNTGCIMCGKQVDTDEEDDPNSDIICSQCGNKLKEEEEGDEGEGDEGEDDEGDEGHGCCDGAE